MLIRTIVLIVVRLFAVQWLAQGLSMLAAAIAELFQSDAGHGSASVTVRLSPALGLLVLCVLAWVVSPVLARLIAGKYDGPIAISVASLPDLYSFAFVFLGLYFVLSSLADVLNWLHYSFVMAASHGDLAPERRQSLYGLSRPLIPLIAGFVCLFSGSKWAKRLHDTHP